MKVFPQEPWILVQEPWILARKPWIPPWIYRLLAQIYMLLA
jgi:hypothetical protein